MRPAAAFTTTRAYKPQPERRQMDIVVTIRSFCNTSHAFNCTNFSFAVNIPSTGIKGKDKTLNTAAIA